MSLARLVITAVGPDLALRGSSSATATRGNAGWLGELLSLVLGVLGTSTTSCGLSADNPGTPLTSGRLALR